MSGNATIVFGLGASGASCVRHLAGRRRLLAFDTRPAPPFLAEARAADPDLAVLAERDWEDALTEAEDVLASPGVALDHPLLDAARAAGLAIRSDVELFLDAAEAPVIGITGTNGKSTVATLVGQLLDAAGWNVGVGGNLGPPALDLLRGDRDAYVLELSSFQLERLPAPRPAAPRLEVAALLNVSADHLDRYPNFAAYAECKRRIHADAKRVVHNGEDARTRPPRGLPAIAFNRDPRWRVADDALIVDGHRLPIGELAPRGRHDHANVVAAAAVAHLAGVDVGARLGVLARFKGLPHRAALVAERCGVAYVDDSKATNVGACAAALAGFGNGARNIVLIAGGDGKGAAFEALAGPVARHVKTLVLLGDAALALGRALGGAVETRYAADMAEAVRLARAAARPGDTVLLAPACASFDMYPNFSARGEHFAKLVAGDAGCLGAAA